MDVREKLIELLEPHMSGLACEYESGSCELTSCRSCNARNIADHLITNGVTVQECKLGVKKTNADRIREMSDEELAMCLYQIGYEEGWDEPKYALEWLRQPAEVIE